MDRVGFSTSQKYSSTSRKIDVRTIGFEPAFTVGTSDSDPPLYDHGYLGETSNVLLCTDGRCCVTFNSNVPYLLKEMGDIACISK